MVRPRSRCGTDRGMPRIRTERGSRPGGLPRSERAKNRTITTGGLCQISQQLNFRMLQIDDRLLRFRILLSSSLVMVAERLSWREIWSRSIAARWPALPAQPQLGAGSASVRCRSRCCPEAKKCPRAVKHGGRLPTVRREARDRRVRSNRVKRRATSTRRCSPGRAWRPARRPAAARPRPGPCPACRRRPPSRRRPSRRPGSPAAPSVPCRPGPP